MHSLSCMGILQVTYFTQASKKQLLNIKAYSKGTISSCRRPLNQSWACYATIHVIILIWGCVKYFKLFDMKELAPRLALKTRLTVI